MQPNQQRFAIWYFLVIVSTLLLVRSMLFAPHQETLSYSEFKSLLRRGKIVEALIDQQTVNGTFAIEGIDSILPKDRVAEVRQAGKGPHPFVTIRVDDPSLVAELDSAKVRFAGRVQNPWSSAFWAGCCPASSSSGCGAS